MKQGYGAYKTASVNTTDKGKLIIICYDVAIKSCSLAISVGTSKVEDFVKHLYKAQDAVNELISSLDLDVGEVAINLYRLYEYMVHRLSNAVIHLKVEPIEEILEYLKDLREAWKIAAKEVKSNPSNKRSTVLNG